MARQKKRVKAHNLGRVQHAIRNRHEPIHLRDQPDDRRHAELIAIAGQRLEGAASDDGRDVARKAVLRQQLAHFHLHQIEQLDIVDEICLVEKHDHVRHADLASEQDVLARLGHRAFRGRHDQDRAVHLGRAGDHVLHIVGVTRTVDVGVVTSIGLILDMSRRDRDATIALLRRRIDLIERLDLAAVSLRHHLGECSSQRGLAMVDVTDGADVDVRFAALELHLHVNLLQSVHFDTAGGQNGHLPHEKAAGKEKAPFGRTEGGFVCSRSLMVAQTLGTTLPSRCGQACGKR